MTDKSWDSMFSAVLDEVGLEHVYSDGSYGGPMKVRHYVVDRTRRHPLMRVLWSEYRTEVAAEVVSEPVAAEAEHDDRFTILDYDGLEIDVRDPRYNEPLREAGERLETEFDIDVELDEAEPGDTASVGDRLLTAGSSANWLNA